MGEQTKEQIRAVYRAGCALYRVAGSGFYGEPLTLDEALAWPAEALGQIGPRAQDLMKIWNHEIQAARGGEG